MEDDDKLLFIHWRGETICWGNIAVAIMDHLELDTEEKFAHLAIEKTTQELMGEAGIHDHPIPKDVISLIEEKNEFAMREELKKAIRNFRNANENRAWFKRDIRKQEIRNLSIGK